MRNCYVVNLLLRKNLTEKLQLLIDIVNYKLKTFMICMIMKFQICNPLARYVH